MWRHPSIFCQQNDATEPDLSCLNQFHVLSSVSLTHIVFHRGLCKVHWLDMLEQFMDLFREKTERLIVAKLSLADFLFLFKSCAISKLLVRTIKIIHNQCIN